MAPRLRPEQCRAALRAQGGACAVCRKARKGLSMYMDQGRARALVCQACRFYLLRFDDERAMRALLLRNSTRDWLQWSEGDEVTDPLQLSLFPGEGA